MRETNYHVLINIGLEDKEARLYMALLELGKGTVLQIARKSKVNRASIYYIIEKMKKRGWVTHLKKEGKDTYMPADPQLLLAQQKAHLKDFESVIPEFKGLLNKTGKRPQVRFYEGLESVKAIYTDTLTSRTEILNYANSEEVRHHWPEYDHEYVNERAKLKIYLRGIAPNDARGKQVQTEDEKYYRKIRLIDPKKLKSTDEINIYDNKIAMVSFKDEIFGVIIESQAMADTQRSIFEMAWNFAGQEL